MNRAPEADADAATGPLPLPALLLLAGLAAGVTAQGAFYLPGQILVGLLLAIAVSAGVGRSRVSGALSSPVPELGVLAAWAVVRGGISGEPFRGAGAVALLLALAACIAICRQLGSAHAGTFVRGLISLGVVVALTGLVGVAFHFEPWALAHGGVWRASSTLTYANASAGLLTPLCLLGAALFTSSSRSLPSQLALMVLIVGSMASLSRAGVLLLATGFVALAVLLGLRRLLGAALGPVCGAAVALAGLAPSIPETSTPRPLPAVLGLLAGMTATWALSRAAAGMAWAAGAALLAGALLVALLFAPVRSGFEALTGSRLTLTSEDRVNEARAALRLLAAHPVFGVGPGRAELRWDGPDGPSQATYVHNEYLQLLAEYGLFGLGVLGVGIAGVVRRIWSGRNTASPRELWVGGSAALAAFGIHSATDFLWHIPVIPLVMAALIGIITPADQYNVFQEG